MPTIDSQQLQYLPQMPTVCTSFHAYITALVQLLKGVGKVQGDIIKRNQK